MASSGRPHHGPENRILLQVTADDGSAAERLFETLIGVDVDPWQLTSENPVSPWFIQLLLVGVKCMGIRGCFFSRA